MSDTITRQQLQQAIDEGTVVVLEALPPEYYDKEHLPGARNLPLDDIDGVAAQLVPDKSQAVVTYCSGTTCANSGIVADRLRELGYSNVRKFPGGKDEWIDAGLPVERGG